MLLTRAISLKYLRPRACSGFVQQSTSEEWASSCALLQEATVNLGSSPTTYGTLFGPAPERGIGLWHLIFHFDNGWLPMATEQPMRASLLKGEGKNGEEGGLSGYELQGCVPPLPPLTGRLRCVQ